MSATKHFSYLRKNKKDMHTAKISWSSLENKTCRQLKKAASWLCCWNARLSNTSSRKNMYPPSVVPFWASPHGHGHEQRAAASTTVGMVAKHDLVWIRQKCFSTSHRVVIKSSGPLLCVFLSSAYTSCLPHLAALGAWFSTSASIRKWVVDVLVHLLISF